MIIHHNITEWSVISEWLVEEKKKQNNLQDTSNDENKIKAWISGHRFEQRRLTDLCGKGTWGRIIVGPKLKMNLRAGLLAMERPFRDLVQLSQI